MTQSQQHSRAQRGQDLAFRIWKPETAPRGVVSLVHGLGEHTGRYAHVASALNARGYVLLGYDLRGHGQSSGQRGHIESYAHLMDDIAHELDEAAKLYPGRPHFLYGHSLGGSLVLNYVLRLKPMLAGVVATSPWLKLPVDPPAATQLLGRVMSGVYPRFALPTGLDTEGLSRDPAVVSAYRNDPRVHDRISARAYVEYANAARWALEHAGEFSLPLLLMHGALDRITSPEGSRIFASRVRGNCTLKIWDGLYHETHNEPEKQEVLSYMLGWLDAHLAS